MAGADRMAIEEVVRKVLVDEHADVLRESVEWLARQLMEVEVSELIGAERGERTEDRATHRNGYRACRWDTRAGEIELQIPKIRQGSNLQVVIHQPEDPPAPVTQDSSPLAPIQMLATGPHQSASASA
jgi:hypothetical protein